MITLYKILPECCADTFLASLLLPIGTIPHYTGIGDVTNGIKKYDGDEYIIGLVDTDKFKRDTEYIKRFVLIEDRIKEEGLLIVRLPDTNKHLIRLHPAFEKWAWATAKSCDVVAANYGFDTYQKFQKAAKKLDVAKNKNIEDFLLDIIDKNPPAIQTLRLWLHKAI